MTEQPFELVAAHDYATLMGALRTRKEHLGLTNLEIERAGGLPDGYAGKLFAAGKHARCLGLRSIGGMLAALEVRLIVVPVERRGAPLPANAVPFASIAVGGRKTLRQQWGRMGGIKGACLMTKAARSRIAQMGGKASGEARRRRKAVTLALETRERKGVARSLKGGASHRVSNRGAKP
jgi:hypothetical protein